MTFVSIEGHLNKPEKVQVHRTVSRGTEIVVSNKSWGFSVGTNKVCSERPHAHAVMNSLHV